MTHLARIFSSLILLIVCFFAVSCNDDDDECSGYYLAVASNEVITTNFYYNDDGTLAVSQQTLIDYPKPTRSVYSYNDNRQLVRVDIGGQSYRTFSYDDEGRVEFIKTYEASGRLENELRYFYDANGNLIRRDLYEEVLTFYNLYEYPSGNTISIQSFEVDDDVETELPTEVYTLDNNPNAYPPEFVLASEARGYYITPHNITELQIFEDEQLDEDQSYKTSYQYNEGGYPVSSAVDDEAFETFSYSCKPVKEM